ncbi:MAG TPA: hypothetical protein VFB80_16310 [Pirellulaceae bacterium]|nr:hypothetical protein [Pirellulaceae bacterium]
MKLCFQCLLLAAAGICLAATAAAQTTQSGSHPPMRPLPVAAKRELAPGKKVFVDAARGDDAAAGSEQAPWKTLAHATRQLQPGDTLYLRGGIYYERAQLRNSGTEAAPITIAGYPGELAILDGGRREFFENPATSWQPLEGGVEGEYVSTRTYFDADDRQVPHQFLPAAWEPMWGIEEERPLALGNFGDSLVPLHGYRLAVDLRSKNELWIGGKGEMRDTGIYCGPGLWFNRRTGRIHIRLARHELAGLGQRAYRGETDPRKLPLIIAVGFGGDVLRASGIQHVRLRDLVLRGATGSPLIHVYGSQNVELDHVTAIGGFPALLINAAKNVRVTHSAFRGLAAPWTSRAHMKYRGTASYQVVLQNNQPANENIELAWCEFTDDHDFAFLRFATNLSFHHNLVENFNDDGLECGPKLRAHTLFISQNRIGPCLIPLTQHEIEKDESPLDHDASKGVFVCRNVFDMRGGTYKGPPPAPDPSGAFLHEEGHLVGDHGGPTWPVMHVYHNTLLRDTPVFRDYFLFGLGAQGLRHSERDVFNNIFVQSGKLPGVGFAGIQEAGRVREAGNILWGLEGGPELKADPFAKFRASPLFAKSREIQTGGWTADDRAVDPRLVRLKADRAQACDLRLADGSPAIDTGVAVPAQWPDPLREQDQGPPDIGALPRGAAAWGVGVDGRIPLFGEPAAG